LRSLVASVLLLLGALLVPVATVAWWADHALLPADGYVDTMAPLASDPAVTAAVQDRLTAVTLQQATRRLGLSQQLASTARPLVRQATGVVVHDPSFVEGWRQANRDVHAQAILVLENRSGAVRGSGSRVEVSLAPIGALLKFQLAARGVPFADQLPVTRATLPLGSERDLERARTAYRLLDRYGPAVPVVSVLLIVAGLVLARRRGAALVGTAVVALLGTGLLAVAVAVGRGPYLAALPAGLPRPAASAVFGTVTAGLRLDLVTVAVALVVALVAGVLTAVGEAAGRG
jgi:hypothetical protein